MQTDPVFGPVLSLGVGGVLTELVRDVAHLVLPVDPAEIRRALLGLRCAPLGGRDFGMGRFSGVGAPMAPCGLLQRRARVRL